LYISVRTISNQREKNDKVEKVDAVLASVSEEFDNGRDLGIAGDIKSGVETIENAISELEGAKEHGVKLDEIEAKIEEAVGILDEIRKVIVIDDSNIISNISGYVEGADASDIILWEDKLYIVDKINGAMYQMSTIGGEVTTLITRSGGLGAPNSFTVDNEGNFLISDLEQGIIKYYPAENRVETITGLSAASVGNITEVDHYTHSDSHTLYVYRAEKNDVNKIARYSSGYSWPTSRINDSRISGSPDMEIDGKFYFLTPSEGIIRYFVDAFDPYTITGLDKEINGGTSLELDDSLVYVGDSPNQRVVIITKGSPTMSQQGKYVVQVHYRGEGNYLGDIREIIVDNEGRVMYILDGTLIFKVDLTKVDEYAEPLLK
jgi:hypothetical protein